MADDSVAEGPGDDFAPLSADPETAPPVDEVPPSVTSTPPPVITSAPESAEQFKGTGINVGLVIGVLLAVVAMIIAFQNTDSVRANFLVWDIDAPLVVIILAAAVAAVLLDEIVGLFWRRRRRRQLAERAELRRFKRR